MSAYKVGSQLVFRKVPIIGTFMSVTGPQDQPQVRQLAGRTDRIQQIVILITIYYYYSNLLQQKATQQNQQREKSLQKIRCNLSKFLYRVCNSSSITTTYVKCCLPRKLIRLNGPGSHWGWPHPDFQKESRCSA